MATVARQLVTEWSDDYDVVVKGHGCMAKSICEHGGDAVAEAAQAFVHSAAALAEKIKKQSTKLAKAPAKKCADTPSPQRPSQRRRGGVLGYAVTYGKRQ
jgi:hypothetical protein